MTTALAPINVGLTPNSNTGDPIWLAFTKVNANESLLLSLQPAFNAALQFGADPTGIADSTVAIQNAINAAAAANGGTVYLVPGTYKIGTSGSGLLISSSNVRIVGQGNQYIVNSGTANSPATKLVWGGSSSAPSAAMIALTSPSGATLNAIFGCQVSGIMFDCQSLCGYGVALTSIKSSNFSQLYVLNSITAAYFLTTLLNANLVDTDTQHNVFTQCLWQCINTTASRKSHGFQLTNASISSSTNGNTSFNTFLECVGINDGTTANSSGICYKLDAADNNSFINCVGYRSNGSTVPSVQLNGNNSSSDGNVFYHYSDTTAANAINILGNATLGSGYNPHQNTFHAVDSNNGVNYPTLDAGCFVNWFNTNGINTNPMLTGALLSGLGNDSVAATQRALVTTETARIYNASQNHIIFTDGTNTWSLNINGSGNLRISGGSGGPATFLAPIQSTGGLGVYNTTPPSQPTGYGTPTGGSHQGSFAAGSITLANLAAAVAQLIIDLKATGMLGA